MSSLKLDYLFQHEKLDFCICKKKIDEILSLLDRIPVAHNSIVFLRSILYYVRKKKFTTHTQKLACTVVFISLHVSLWMSISFYVCVALLSVCRFFCLVIFILNSILYIEERNSK